jgi:hypothetical protein
VYQYNQYLYKEFFCCCFMEETETPVETEDAAPEAESAAPVEDAAPEAEPAAEVEAESEEAPAEEAESSDE